MEDFADIEGLVPIGLPVWVWLALAAVLLGLVAVAVGLWLRRRRTPAPASAEPVRAPREVALERLAALRAREASMAAEPFTVEVSDIVRDYLEAALAIPAREQTSEEFLQALEARPDLPAALRAHMPPFLEQCDRVKFARQDLAGAQRGTLLQAAQAVVEAQS